MRAGHLLGVGKNLFDRDPGLRNLGHRWFPGVYSWI